MPVITLPDGSKRHFDHAVSVADIAASIGPALAKAALAAKIDGNLVETSAIVHHDALVSIVTDRDPEGLEIIRHFLEGVLVEVNQDLVKHTSVPLERADVSQTARDAEAAAVAPTRVEEGLRAAEHYQAEARTLRESLATRDTTIAQTLHSLAERDAQLHALQHELRESLATRDATIAQTLHSLAERDAQLHALQHELRKYAEIAARIDAWEVECKRMRDELATRDHGRAAAEKQHEEELAVLMAQLNEARRPDRSIQADVKRLSDELDLKTRSLERLNEDNRHLRAAMELSEGSANVQDQIQTGIERLGGAPASTAAPAVPMECFADLIRIDGERNTKYTLARRTRIGRASGCDLQIDSTLVSRHHALLLKSDHELIIEDLNSVNGVLVNGRKISRRPLKDGDLVTLGEVKFRCVLKIVPRLAELGANGPGAREMG